MVLDTYIISGPGSVSGFAGGVIRIVSDELFVNGQLHAIGRAGTLSGAGGSGGSIYIQTISLQGNGSVSANGGAGSNSGVHYGGGGAGGRIAIYFTNNSYNGSITSVGGEGYTGLSGGPGTIFIQDQSLGFKKLIVNNEGLVPNMDTANDLIIADVRGTVAWLMNETLHEFDEVRIAGNAALAIESPGSNVSIFLYV